MEKDLRNLIKNGYIVTTRNGNVYIKVWGYAPISDALTINTSTRKILWSRSNEYLVCILVNNEDLVVANLLYSLDYKFIARDLDNTLYAYKELPEYIEEREEFYEISLRLIDSDKLFKDLNTKEIVRIEDIIE